MRGIGCIIRDGNDNLIIGGCNFISFKWSMKIVRDKAIVDG